MTRRTFFTRGAVIVGMLALVACCVCSNWPASAKANDDSATSQRGASPNGVAAIKVALPIKQDPSGGPSIIPVVVGDTTGQGIFSFDFDISFNPAVLQPQSPAFDTSGTLSSGYAVNTSTFTDGGGNLHLLLNAFGTSELTGQGTLIKLKFNVVGVNGSTTPLTWVSFNFNEGTPPDTDINGNFTAASPSAADGMISGRITTADGAPVAGSTVTIQSSAGTFRAITNSGGFYQLQSLKIGELYTVTPSRANYSFSPAIRSFSLIADQADAVFTALPGVANSNPLETPEFFVRQQYLDFLGREPDQGGLDFWSGQVRACGGDDSCLAQKRIDVSAAFFIAQEFQDSGLYLYDMYKAALGRQPGYSEYAVDRQSVVGGPSLNDEKTAFANSFVQRSEFTNQYPQSLNGPAFVDALLLNVGQTSGVDLTASRQNLITLYNSGANMTAGRAAVLRDIADTDALRQTQYNSAFVLSEYFSYLGRNPDSDGYSFWLNVVNNGDHNNYRGMVCSFLTSSEYQHRFSSIVTRTNAECR